MADAPPSAARTSSPTDQHTAVRLPPAPRFHRRVVDAVGLLREAAERTRKISGAKGQSLILPLTKAHSDPWNTEPVPPLPRTLRPRSKIIPIMQRVCDCRNPPWPRLCSLPGRRLTEVVASLVCLLWVLPTWWTGLGVFGVIFRSGPIALRGRSGVAKTQG